MFENLITTYQSTTGPFLDLHMFNSIMWQQPIMSRQTFHLSITALRAPVTIDSGLLLKTESQNPPRSHKKVIWFKNPWFQLFHFCYGTLTVI